MLIYSMSAKSKKLPVYLIVASLALAVLGLWWFQNKKTSSSAETAGIFVVTPLEYGNTTLSGVIQKDAAVGDVGKYYLVTSDSHTILLDAQDIDAMIDETVVATGYLTPPAAEGDLPYMIVSSMESKQYAQ